MKILVIGGTKGFGKEVLNILLKKNNEITIIGRSNVKIKGVTNYACDIGNLNELRRILKMIKLRNNSLDALFCIVGFARAKKSSDLKISDWQETLSKNLLYVTLVLQELRELLNKSKNPKVVTIGSQWSYKVGYDELLPYIISKHALRALTEDFAVKNKWIKINHFCVPTMKTPGNLEVQKSINNLSYKKRMFKFRGVFAEPKIVANSLVTKFLTTNLTGSTFIINPNGTIKIKK